MARMKNWNNVILLLELASEVENKYCILQYPQNSPSTITERHPLTYSIFGSSASSLNLGTRPESICSYIFNRCSWVEVNLSKSLEAPACVESEGVSEAADSACDDADWIA